MTTTSFGSYYNAFNSQSPAEDIANYISGGDYDWREAMEDSGALKLIEADYRAEIEALLPEGLDLCGTEFIGDIELRDMIDWDGIREMFETIDLAAIVSRHDIDA